MIDTMNVASLARAFGAQLLLGLLSRRRYERLPVLTPALDEPVDWPRVSIVVPARDEAARLPALLRSLQVLDYPDYAVIVVDDESHDDTVAVAAREGARVVRGTPLPDGWTGKSHACQQGATASDGALLLFTDADTVHEPASLRSAVAYLRCEGLGALSLITGQRCDTFFERLLLPLAYAVLFAGVSPSRVNRVGGSSPLANGQYILCRRDAYERVGGHAAVRGSLIEDAALARALSRASVPYRLCRAESLVGVRMYGGLGDLWAGFRKNAARYVLDDPRRLPATALYSTTLGSALPLLIQAASTLLPEPALTLWPGPKGPWQDTDPEGSTRQKPHADLSRSGPCHGPSGPGSSRSDQSRSGQSRSGPRRWLVILALAHYLVGVAGLAPWYRRFGVPARYAALYPLAVGIFGLVTVDSLWRVLGRRGSSWKGRTYR